MKILDDITNEVIKDKVAVKIQFHPYDLESQCLTLDIKSGEERFKKKTMFVSKETAQLLLGHIDSMEEAFENPKDKKNELDQVLIQFSPTEEPKGFREREGESIL